MALLASYKVAHRIAKSKEPYAVAEEQQKISAIADEFHVIFSYWFL